LVLPPLTRKVRKIGDSLTINIPVEILDILKFKEGELLSVDIEGDKMIVKKKEEK
jgi:antitoxin component of MazEF toxin-antitoxin module